MRSQTILICLAFLTFACGPSTQRPLLCSESGCEGCCDDDGICRVGTDDSACGAAGAACQVCTTQSACIEGACQPQASDAGGGEDDGGTEEDGGTTGTDDGGTRPSSNDSCADPMTLTITNGVGSAVETLAGAADDAEGQCGGAGGPDKVFRFSTAAMATWVIEARPHDPTAKLAVYMRSACDVQNTEVPGACAAAASGGGAVQLTTRDLAAGDYYVWVDVVSGPAAGFDLSVTHVPGAGNTCQAPIPLTLVNGEANASGTTAGLTNAEAGTCGGAGAPDVVYAVTLDEIRDLEVTVHPTTATFRPVVYVHSTCSSGERVCSVGAAAGQDATAALGSLPAGTYYLWVDGHTGSSGSYTLTVRARTPAAGDTCANPAGLTFTPVAVGSAATVTGDTRAVFDDEAGTCGGSTGADIVYTFTTTTAVDFEAVLTPAADFRPVLYLSSACATGERSCETPAAAGDTTTLREGALPPGTYWLWVDGHTGSAGTYSLTVRLTPPQQGDSCLDPIPLNLSSGSASLTGDTGTFFNNAAGTCGGASAADIVYGFSTAGLTSFTATVTPTATFRPIVYLLQGCTGTQRQCTPASAAGQPATLTTTNLPAGTYGLWVDGYGGSTGSYTLQISAIQ